MHRAQALLRVSKLASGPAIQFKLTPRVRMVQPVLQLKRKELVLTAFGYMVKKKKIIIKNKKSLRPIAVYVLYATIGNNFLITVILKIRNVMLCLCFLTKKIIHYISCRFVKTIKFTCNWTHKTHTYAICIWSCGDTEVILGNFRLEYCLTRPNSWSIHPISYL